MEEIERYSALFLVAVNFLVEGTPSTPNSCKGVLLVLPTAFIIRSERSAKRATDQLETPAPQMDEKLNYLAVEVPPPFPTLQKGRR